jgi:hypothetical protein
MARVKVLEDGHIALSAAVQANTNLTQAVKTDTLELVEFTKAIKGLVTLVRWVGRALQWLAPIALVVVSAWAVFKDKKL